jgi:hypothetical protein
LATVLVRENRLVLMIWMLLLVVAAPGGLLGDETEEMLKVIGHQALKNHGLRSHS